MSAAEAVVAGEPSGDDDRGPNAGATGAGPAALPPGRPTVSAALPALPPESPDRYHVLGELGRGGLGRVLRVFDTRSGREVALKLLEPRDHAGPGVRSARERFLAEAQITAQLQHPAIVPVYELGVFPSGQLFYTMPIVAGQSLRQALRDYAAGRDALPEPERRRRRRRLLAAYAQVCQAVAYAHDRGVIHRDLKPANVMLGPFGETVLLDWGLAKNWDLPGEEGGARPVRTDVDDVERTRWGLVSGTPAYMAPEQAAGDAARIGPATDVYALGVMLYELLTQQTPFGGAGAPETIRRVLEEEPEPPSRHQAPDQPIPPDLEAACLAALQKDPAERGVTAALLAREVEAFLEGSRERERMARRCQARLEEARHLVTEHEALRRQHDGVSARAARLKADVAPHAGPAAKRPLWEAEAALEDLRRRRDIVFDEAVRKFNEALSFDPADPQARRELAALFLDQMCRAEDRQDHRQAAFFRAQVEYYDDGAAREALQGDGRLAVTSDPPGAPARLFRYRERDRLWRPVFLMDLGLTPTAEQPLAMGGYLLELRAPDPSTPLGAGSAGGLPRAAGPLVPGGAARRPVGIRRGEQVRAHVTLFDAAQMGADCCYVPAGRYLSGEAETLVERALGNFCLARAPVTFAEYAAYLDALAAEMPQAVPAAIPVDAEFGPLLARDAAGRFAPRVRPDLDQGHGAASGFGLRASDQEGACSTTKPEAWSLKPHASRPDAGFALGPDVPVINCTLAQVEGFLRWRGARDGRAYRLPTRFEWEKAARGVDGRRYPWGEQWDATYCKNLEARAGPPGPEPVGAFPVDTSPYGVRDMAGGVAEWTATWADERRSLRVICGGHWASADPERTCRIARVDVLEPRQARRFVGFRLCHEPRR